MSARLWPAEAEHAVLSAILGAASFDADAGRRVLHRARRTGLVGDMFGLASCGVIFDAMTKLADDGVPVDPVSVAAELDGDHVDPYVVSRLRVLAHELAPFSAIERYAVIVRDCAERREVEERASS